MIINKAADKLRVLRRYYLSLTGKAPKSKVQVKLKTERHGSDYGGWVIKQNSVSSAAIVYSFGIGKDVSFDLSLIKKYGVNVHAFDPTPGVKEWLDAQNLPVQFHYHPLAISNTNGILKFNKPENSNNISHSILLPNKSGNFTEVQGKRLASIMQTLNHNSIDILKMDIEGAEYAVIADILSSEINITQVLIEFHHFYSNVHAQQTEQAVNLLNKHGYKIFYISPNGYEYSFCR